MASGGNNFNDFPENQLPRFQQIGMAPNLPNFRLVWRPPYLPYRFRRQWRRSVAHWVHADADALMGHTPTPFLSRTAVSASSQVSPLPFFVGPSLLCLSQALHFVLGRPGPHSDPETTVQYRPSSCRGMRWSPFVSNEQASHFIFWVWPIFSDCCCCCCCQHNGHVRWTLDSRIDATATNLQCKARRVTVRLTDVILQYTLSTLLISLLPSPHSWALSSAITPQFTVYSDDASSSDFRE